MDETIYKTGILIVDDEHFIRMLLVQALISLGFQAVWEANSGQDALRVLAQAPVELIITDIEMKHGDGFDLAHALRTGETSLPRNTPLIFLTGLSDVSTLSTATRFDVQGFLAKPVSANQLLDKIRQAMATPVKVQAPPAYDAITGSAAASEISPARPSLTQPPEDTTTSRLIDVLMLEEGMTLRQDVYAHGRLLLRAPIKLLPPLIMVLQDMRGLLDDRQVKVDLP